MLIEQAMIFALGFLAALLMVLLFLPAFWARAIRLSVRRVAEQMPLSMAEIVAERDGLRAEHAIVQRRLEQERDRALAAHTELRGESGRMSVKLADLGQAVEAHSTEVAELEARLADAGAALLSAEAALAVVSKDHYDSSGLLERANRTVEHLHAEMQRVRDVSDQRRVTAASLETRIESLQAKIDDLEASLHDAEQILQQKTGELKAVTRARDEARTEVVRLHSRRAELDARVATQSAQIARLQNADEEAAGSGAEPSEVAHYLDLLAKRDETILGEAARYAKLEAQMKRLMLEQAESEQQLMLRVETLRSEKYAVEGALETARRERDAAQRELRVARAAGGLPRETGGSGDSEDLALLRRSIVEVAADVVRLMGEKDPASDLTSDNVLQLRRERGGGGRDQVGKPPTGGSDQPSSAQSQAAGTKLS